MENWKIQYQYSEEIEDKSGRTLRTRCIREDVVDRDTALGVLIMRDAKDLFNLLGEIKVNHIPEHSKTTITLALTDQQTGKTYKREATYNPFSAITFKDIQIPDKIHTGGIINPWEILTDTDEDKKSQEGLRMWREIVSDWNCYYYRKKILEQRERSYGTPDANEVYEKGVVWSRIEADFRREEKRLIVNDIHDWLGKYGVIRDKCDRLFAKYGKEYKRELQRYPWRYLIDDLGLSLLQCRKMYADMGLDDFKEMQKGTVAAVRKDAERNGGSFVSYNRYIKYMDYLDIPADPFIGVYDEDVLHNDIYGNAPILVDTEAAEKELRIAQKIVRICNRGRKAEVDADALRREIEQESGITLGNEQSSAFVKILTRKGGMHIITGGPGTGKTQLTKAILAAWQKTYKNDVIRLCAPTGRAAQKMAEVTEHEATTIHMMLEYQPYSDSFKWQRGTLPGDLVIVDEVSMLDIDLCDKLLDAINPSATVVFIGDADQLESVGPGAVLQDLLNSKNRIQKHRLTEVFRQAGDSAIISNAVKIQQGQTDIKNGPDLNIVRCGNPLMALSFVRDMMHRIYKKDDPFSVQILCPAKKGEAGINVLNTDLQKLLNPAENGILYGFNGRFKKGDKVLFNRNNYAEGYYNGDLGIIKEINEDKMTVAVRDKEIEVLRELWEDVSLAYAMTIHKAQGSEFDNVLIVMTQEYPGMLTRNLLYTALTRAKKNVCIFSEKDAIEKAILNDKRLQRNTLLKTYIEREEAI